MKLLLSAPRLRDGIRGPILSRLRVLSEASLRHQVNHGEIQGRPGEAIIDAHSTKEIQTHHSSWLRQPTLLIRMYCIITHYYGLNQNPPIWDN
mmetsp:Transcript_20439/g.70698  ORF Transcript_20439/g.70698 Transcript_20439/m.70698 type:complete len:93 (+) Transcript_20439:1082-1360(+)